MCYAIPHKSLSCQLSSSSRDPSLLARLGLPEISTRAAPLLNIPATSFCSFPSSGNTSGTFPSRTWEESIANPAMGGWWRGGLGRGQNTIQVISSVPDNFMNKVVELLPVLVFPSSIYFSHKKKRSIISISHLISRDRRLVKVPRVGIGRSWFYSHMLLAVVIGTINFIGVDGFVFVHKPINLYGFVLYNVL